MSPTSIFSLSLHDALPIFTNFAISFTIISVLAGCFTNFSFAWNAGGPIAISREREVREAPGENRSEEHTAELQSRFDIVCRLLLDKKKVRRRHGSTGVMPL